jgi:hypothetical protein
MAARTSMINMSADHEELVERLSKRLGTDKLRRKLFNTVYGRGRVPRSLKQIMTDADIKFQHRQQAQNQIDHLAKYHLIVRQDNDGSVKDGSRYLYLKDDHVRALRDEIIRCADNPKLAKRLATKRRPEVTTIKSVRAVKRQILKKKKRLNVLYLTADTDRNHRLRVDAEMSRVKEAIRGSEYRDNITVDYAPAAKLKTLQDGLNDHRPQIIHFSGHGNMAGIAMDNGKIVNPASEPLSFSLLAKALAATDNPPSVVVLNSCHSSGARKVLLKQGLIVVSMKTSISDLAAITFAPRFYAAIASGQSVKSAFGQGKVAVENASITEADTPELFWPDDVNPAKVILA